MLRSRGSASNFNRQRRRSIANSIPMATLRWTPCQQARQLCHSSPSRLPAIPLRINHRLRASQPEHCKSLERRCRPSTPRSIKQTLDPPRPSPPPSLQSPRRRNYLPSSRKTSPTRQLHPLHRHPDLPLRFLSPRSLSTTPTTSLRSPKISCDSAWRVERRARTRTSTLARTVDRISTAYTSRRSTRERRTFWGEEREFTTS